MPKEYIASPLKITADIEGLSLKSISEHYKLYEGYVKKVKEIREKIDAADKSAPNATYSELGELKRQETFAVNGAKLHEVFFKSLGPTSQELRGASGKVADMIIRDFGSMENWVSDMTAAGLSSRGWVIAAYDLNEERIRNYSADAHNLGVVYGCIPLVALDVYEHAYFMDHGTSRKAYIEAFFKNLNWKAVDENLILSGR
ncbi:MAG: Fe-Mn family superoxide dismutase [Candidatus Colwellbacteria bacterium]|nr:Fe-Mn family superoxide dismutase [Candidatus Colwellbacteria bacterium]